MKMYNKMNQFCLAVEGVTNFFHDLTKKVKSKKEDFVSKSDSFDNWFGELTAKFAIFALFIWGGLVISQTILN